MVRENLPSALILEDDIEIDANLPDIVTALAQEQAPVWMVVRLSSIRGRVLHPKKAGDYGRKVKILTNNAIHRLNTHVLGFGAYFVTQEGARRMLAYGQRIFMPIDQTMDRFWENNIPPYIVRPFPVRQTEAFESRIGARPAGRHRGQSFGFWLRRRRQRLSDGLQKRLFILFHT